MRCILRLLSSFGLLICAGAAWSQAAPQRINPNTQIDWAQATNCNLSGYAYIPYSSACAPSASGSFFPLIGGRLAQSGTFEGSYYANEWQYPANTGNNGIAEIIAYCITNAISPCTLTAPSIYTLGDLPTWNQWQFANSQLLQPSLTQTVSSWDERDGFYRMYIDPLSNFAGQNIAVGEASVSKFYHIISPGQRYNAYIGSMFGENHYANGLQAPYGKTSSYAAYFYGSSFTAEQHYGINVQAYGLAPGDVVSEVRGAYGPAGANTNGDESIEITSDTASQTINVFRGACATGCTTGSGLITVTPTAPTSSAGESIQGTQGQQRWMTLQTPATSLTATSVTDNVQQLSSTYGYFTSIAAAGGITTSTGWGLLVSAIAAPPYSGSGAAQIPGVQTFTFSTSGGTLTNGLACVADQVNAGNGYFDLVTLSGVSGGSGTATFQYVHPVGAAIFQGGQCGQLADIVQDDLPSGYTWSNGEGGGTTVFPVQVQWPVVGSVDGTHLIVWSARPGQGGTNTTFSASSGSQTVNLYYGALVLGVTGANNDLSDDKFTLGPNAVPFTTSASLIEAQYPSQRVGGYVLNVSSWFPHAFGQYPVLVNWAHGAQGNDSGILVSNGNPQSEYVGFGGLTPPPASAYELRGTFQYGYLPHGTFTKGLFPVIPWNLSNNFTSPDCLFEPLNSNFGSNGDSLCYLWGGSSGQGGGTWAYTGNLSVVGNMVNNYNFTGSVNTLAGFFSGNYANYAPNNTNLLGGAGGGTSWTVQGGSTGTQTYATNQPGPPGWGNTATCVTTTGSYFQLQDEAGSTYTAVPASTPWAAATWVKGVTGTEQYQFGSPNNGGATTTVPDNQWHLQCTQASSSGTTNLGNIFGIAMVGAETVCWVGMTSAPGACPIGVPAGHVQGASQTITPIPINTAPTQAPADSSNQIATDLFVANYVPQVTAVTSATFNFGATYNSGFYYNENATAATAVTGTLPTPVVGMQYCVKNFNNGTAPTTGTVEVIVNNTSTQKIVQLGTASTSGYIISSGAAGDAACFVAVSTTQWDFVAQAGTWTLH